MKIQESTVALNATHEFRHTRTLQITTPQEFHTVFERLAKQSDEYTMGVRHRLQKLLQTLIEAIFAAIDGKTGKNVIAVADELPQKIEHTEGDTRINWQRAVIECLDESELSRVCGSGMVKTADGRNIDFKFGFDLARSYSSRKLWTESGAVNLRDPLILSFAGNSCELTEESIEFDLDADGVLEKIPGLGACSGFLVFDRNGNGKADDGSELFGALSGNGFADLNALDSDQNGWIDEADTAWNQLAVWSAGSFNALPALGVGALYTGAVESPFSLKTVGNDLLGQIRSAGLYLAETGEVGILQQVDLAVASGKEHLAY